MNSLPNELIPDSAVQAALEYLAQDPAPVAIAKGEMVRAENLRKKIRSEGFMKSDKKTVAEREADSETSPSYEAACKHEADAVEKYESERARVTWATTITELWRSVQANARAAERVR